MSIEKPRGAERASEVEKPKDDERARGEEKPIRDKRALKMSDNIKLEPHSGPCFNFLRGTKEETRTVWLTPHIVQRREDRLEITWRCNWGHICESDCIYRRSD